MDGLGNISETALKTNELDMAKGHCRVHDGHQQRLFSGNTELFSLVCGKVGHEQSQC